MIKASVLMPVYNGEKYVSESIDSILRQSFKNFEFIIVDDGSIDGTSEILKKYAQLDNRIKIITQKNCGIVSALNAGLEVAQGEYVVRMDSDDVAFLRRVELQVDFMDKNINYVVCGSCCDKIGSGNGLIKMPVTDEQCKSYLAIKNCFVHPTVIIRNSVIKINKIRYRNNYEYAEDYDLWTRLAVFGKFHNIPEPLIGYRIHLNQTSNLKMSLQRSRHVKSAVSYLKNNGIDVTDELLANLLWPNLSVLKGWSNHFISIGLFVFKAFGSKIKCKKYLSVEVIKNSVGTIAFSAKNISKYKI